MDGDLDLCPAFLMPDFRFCVQVDTVNAEIVTYNGIHEIESDPEGMMNFVFNHSTGSLRSFGICNRKAATNAFQQLGKIR